MCLKGITFHLIYSSFLGIFSYFKEKTYINIKREGDDQMTNNNTIRSILGVDVRPRSSKIDKEHYEPFKNPLIHKQINGRVIVPLDSTRLWGR
jgi:hypothetical protein